MSSTHKQSEFTQPSSFDFNQDNLKAIKKILDCYPPENKRAAVMPLLHLAQQQNNHWIPRAAMDRIAVILDIPAMHVYEVANFYTMYNKKPVGTHLVQVCSTTPCWLRGSNGIMKVCKEQLGIAVGETTTDKNFTLVEVECLGACVNGPVVQINNDYYEDLKPESMKKILENLANNVEVLRGSQSGRLNSAPAGWQSQAEQDDEKQD